MLRSSLLVILFAFSGAAIADDFNYNAFTISYGQTDFDDINVDGSSIDANVWAEVSESFFVFGSYGVADLEDDFGINADADSWSAGIGHHLGLTESVDLVSRVSYEYIDLTVPGFGSVDDSGYGLGLGLRYALSGAIELNAGVDYVDLSDSGDETSFNGGVLLNLTDSFTVGLNGEFGDDVTVYSVGARFYFGE